MPIFSLTDDLIFPDPHLAEPSGLLAVGGDLRPERLLLAYGAGIFPWPHEGLPLLWFSPQPRMVFVPADTKPGRTLRKASRRGGLELRADSAFQRVMLACSRVPRPGQDGTWINREMREAYVRLHKMGFAHSFEAWRDDRLVGGLYGVSLGGIFCGESMFHLEANASKLAFFGAAMQLARWEFDLIDGQVPTEHLESLGGQEMDRDQFLGRLEGIMARETRLGPWRLDPDIADLSAFTETQAAASPPDSPSAPASASPSETE